MPININIARGELTITYLEINSDASQFVVSTNEGIMFLYELKDKKKYEMFKTIKGK